LQIAVSTWASRPDLDVWASGSVRE